MDCVRRFEEAVLRRNDVLECLLLSSDMNYWLRLRLACLTDFETIRADLLADLPGVQDMMASFVICDVLRRRDTPT
nr:Lrp/AsnC ligand binding domain-containing protein [Stakelama sediminis]